MPQSQNSHADWFDQAVAEDEHLHEGYESSRRSAVWFKSSARGGRTQLIQQILACARSVARNHGLPKRTEIRLASMEDIGAGAAGFRDAPRSFFRPYILLDKSPLSKFNNEDVMDIYCGIVLHEAGHILHTREGYRRLAEPGRHPLINMFENLLEDVRIEALVCNHSPGYAPYIYAARFQLLHRGPFGQSMRDWKTLPEPERALALITAFIRIPQLIPAACKTWKTPTEDCVFDSLRKLLPRPPMSESDVERMARRLFEYYKTLDERITDDPPAEEESTGDDSDDQPQSPTPPRPNRFAPEDLQAAINAMNAIGETFDNATLQAVSADHQQANKKFAEHEWEWLGEKRKVIVELAAIDSAAAGRYQRALSRVSNLVASMKSAIPRIGASRKLVRRDLTAGKLDQRRIALASVSPRIFRKTAEVARTRIDIGLLLDGSGSMTGERAMIARETAVVMAEAFAGDPRVAISVYSHTSPYFKDQDCLVRVHFGPHQKDRTGIGAFYAQQFNYDHCAIETCNDLLATSAAPNSKRLLIVVSDGQPCGVEYGFDSAISAASAAVKKARATGTIVIGVGVAGHHCNEIYGERWLLNVSDVAELPKQLRNLLTRLFRGS